MSAGGGWSSNSRFEFYGYRDEPRLPKKKKKKRKKGKGKSYEREILPYMILTSRERWLRIEDFFELYVKKKKERKKK